jgi:arsenate reductase-like glutaredoxin family protein
MVEGGEIAARAIIIAKMKYLEKYRGGDIPKSEKKDCELFYMRTTYLEFTKHVGKATSLEDEKLSAWMMENHPRWYELVETYGNPIEELNNIKQKGKNIKANSISVKIQSKLPKYMDKVYRKKLLGNMLVGAVKTLCSKLFLTGVLSLKLSFVAIDETQEYELNDDIKELSFYGLYDGATIFVSPVGEEEEN